MSYRRTLKGGIVVTSTRAEHAPALERLQELIFPTLADALRFKAAHYRNHVELFPEGQFVALDGERVVGATSSIRMSFDFEHVDHRFEDVIAGGWLTAHEPEGAWLYGADVGTLPEFRRRGVARGLYAARHDTVRRLGLLGQVTVGMLAGYGAVRDRVSAAEYFQDLAAGRREDPTISAQMRVGFELVRLLPGYLDDPVCDGNGVLIVLPAERDVGSE